MAVGAGKIREGSKPKIERACQTSSNRAGTNQGTRMALSRRLLLGERVLAISPDLPRGLGPDHWQ